MKEEYYNELYKYADELSATEGLCSVTLGALDAMDNSCSEVNIPDLNLSLSVIKERIGHVRESICDHMKKIKESDS